MASKCKICGKVKKSTQPVAQWKNETDGYCYLVHLACKKFLLNAKAAQKAWNFKTLKQKKK